MAHPAAGSHPAFAPLSARLSRAFALYEQGDSPAALGVSFDVLDRLTGDADAQAADARDNDGRSLEPLLDAALYLVSRIYADRRTPAGAKEEILTRIDACHSSGRFRAADDYLTGPFHPVKLLAHYGSFVMENRCRPLFGLPAFAPAEAETDACPDGWEQLRTTVAARALQLTDDCAALSDEALILLARLYAALYFFVDDHGRRTRDDATCQEMLDEIGEELDYRCRTVQTLHRQGPLLEAASAYSRIWPWFDEASSLHLQQTFIAKVASAPEVPCTVLHAALLLLQREPLTVCVPDDDACGGRRYVFSTGEKLFRSTLHAWADAQLADGSWPGVTAAEAYGRIAVVGADFGSMYEVDNYRLTIAAYNHYCTTPCHTPADLYAKHRAWSLQRRLTSARMSVPIMRQTRELLQSSPQSLPARLCLYNIVMS